MLCLTSTAHPLANLPSLWHCEPMGKTVFVYGSIIALTAFALSWLDTRFWMRDIGFEIYGLGIAVLFAGLGIWIERQRNPETATTSKARNDKAIKALGLTRREVEMLDFLTLGKSNKEIARDLDLSPNTVKTHLANMYEKLGVRNRTQAVSKALEMSLTLPARTG